MIDNQNYILKTTFAGNSKHWNSAIRIFQAVFDIKHLNGHIDR